MKKVQGIISAFAALLLVGCGGGNNDLPSEATYQVTITNGTANQPFSPPALVLHEEGYRGWEVAMAASTGLEKLAEGGATADFLSEAENQKVVVMTKSGTGIVAPGSSTTMELKAYHSYELRLSVATMLVNTNDAFAGKTDQVVGTLNKDEQMTFTLPVYDAGTESNDETAATIPGPAGGGEGYNSLRETKNFVSLHQGVVTSADGLASSALSESHRFLGPVAKVTVRRTM